MRSFRNKELFLGAVFLGTRRWEGTRKWLAGDTWVADIRLNYTAMLAAIVFVHLLSCSRRRSGSSGCRFWRISLDGGIGRYLVVWMTSREG